MGDDVPRAVMQAHNDTGQGPYPDAARDNRQVVTGDLAVFAAHAATALTGARRPQEANAALEHRDVIGQAKGILMERFQLGSGAVFATLLRLTRDNIKLRHVCENCAEPATAPAAAPTQH